MICNKGISLKFLFYNKIHAHENIFRKVLQEDEHFESFTGV